jgi:voltage-gated potassium channel
MSGGASGVHTATNQTAGWDDLDWPQRRRLVAAAVARLVFAVTGLLVVYATIPIDGRSNVASIVVMIVGALAFVGAVVIQFRRILHSPYPTLRAVQAVVVVVLVFLVGFSLSYLTMSTVNPANFSEPLDRLDAFYFTTTVAATVGFGDITATTGVARLVVTLQMLLGLSLLAVLVRVATGIATHRRQSSRAGQG